MSSINISAISLPRSATIGEAIACIDRSGRASLALIVDAEQRLINTLTDGDVRRGILAGYALGDSIEGLLDIKTRMPHAVPVTAAAGTSGRDLLALMQGANVRQVPLLDNNRRVVDVALLRDLLPQTLAAVEAIVMAGGEGLRLRPLTDQLPKPMLPVGGKPLMELIVDKLRTVGVRKINITTHYRPEAIVDHFGDGSAFGVDISYVNENTPLGTGGALGLLPRLQGPMLVMNGDILSDIDIEAFYQYHQDQRADMTVAVRRYELQVPYGVVECENTRILGIKEKPNLGFFVNAGIYLIEPSVQPYLPAAREFQMTDVIEKLVANDRRVEAYPIREYWVDIGRHADYEQAQQHADGRPTCAGVDA